LSNWRFLGSTESDRLARLAGILYFLVLPTAGAWFQISAPLLGGDGASLTALQSNRFKLEVALALGATGHVIQLIVVVMFHRLLSPYGKLAANLMLTFLAVSMPLAFAAIAREMDLLSLLDGGGLTALGPEQLQAQIAMTAHAYTNLFNAASCFWGLWLFPLGLLLVRSRFVPRVLGCCVFLGGPLYLFAFVSPVFNASSTVANVVGIASGIPDLIGEIGTAVWLAVRGARGASAAPAGARAAVTG
jgi:hypothetical protein